MKFQKGFTLHKSFCLFFLGLWLSSPAVSADHSSNHIFLSTLKIEGLIGSSADNKYTRLLNMAAQKQGAKLVINEVPGNRLEHQFRMIGNGCLFPEYRAPKNIPVINSTAFNQALVHMIWQKGAQPPANLNGLRIGLVKGYGYGFADLSVTQSIIYVESERQNLLMLLFGRVDAILSYFPDLPLVATPSELEKIAYDPIRPLHKSPERIACFNTDKNRAFLASLDEMVNQLAHNGKLEEMLSPYFYGLPAEGEKTDEGN